jgi:hypothetical protein
MVQYYRADRRFSRGILELGCDAGIRYDERLEQDMIAVPIGPRIQRFADAASPAYIDRRGRPAHPSGPLAHACLRSRFPSGCAGRQRFVVLRSIIVRCPRGRGAGRHGPGQQRSHVYRAPPRRWRAVVRSSRSRSPN